MDVMAFRLKRDLQVPKRVQYLYFFADAQPLPGTPHTRTRPSHAAHNMLPASELHCMCLDLFVKERSVIERTDQRLGHKPFSNF